MKTCPRCSSQMTYFYEAGGEFWICPVCRVIEVIRQAVSSFWGRR